jgi:Skp family chaperone for outer membrane proteins
MKISFVKVALSTVALFCVGAIGANAQLKVGTVESAKILTDMPEFQTVQNQVKQMQQAYQDTLELANKQFNKQLEDYQQKKTTMTPENIAKTEDQLQKQQQRMLQYQQAHLGSQGTVAQKYDELLQPIREKVVAAIKVIAERQGLDAVMESGNFVYVDPQLDITYDVLKYLQTGK